MCGIIGFVRSNTSVLTQAPSTSVGAGCIPPAQPAADASVTTTHIDGNMIPVRMDSVVHPVPGTGHGSVWEPTPTGDVWVGAPDAELTTSNAERVTANAEPGTQNSGLRPANAEPGSYCVEKLCAES